MVNTLLEEPSFFLAPNLSLNFIGSFPQSSQLSCSLWPLLSFCLCLWVYLSLSQRAFRLILALLNIHPVLACAWSMIIQAVMVVFCRHFSAHSLTQLCPPLQQKLSTHAWASSTFSSFHEAGGGKLLSWPRQASHAFATEPISLESSNLSGGGEPTVQQLTRDIPSLSLSAGEEPPDTTLWHFPAPISTFSISKKKMEDSLAARLHFLLPPSLKSSC